MTFAYPILLGGLVLAGLPVLLHFLVRQKPKTLPFPAYRFLLQKRRSNTQPSAQASTAAFAANRSARADLSVLARPRVLNEQFGLTKEKPAVLVLIFDTSPSMDYKSGDMTRLDLAKSRSLELLDQLPEDGRVLILDASDPASFAREDWLKSLDKARQRINSLTIRPDNTPVTKALDEARCRFDEWDRTGDDPEGLGMPRFVCIFSDRTKASWDSSAAAKLKANEDAVPVRMLYFDVGIDDPADLAILDAVLPDGRQSFADGEKIALRVVARSDRQDVETDLLVQVGKNTLKQSFEAKAGEAQTRTFNIDTTGLGAGMHPIEVSLAAKDDSLSFNNKRFVTFQIIEKQRILVVTDDAKKAQTFAGALRALLYDVELKLPNEKWDPDRYACVFLFGVAAPPEPLWKSLEAYRGGIGIVPPGEEIDRSAYLGEAALKVMPAKFDRIIELPNGTAGQWDVTSMDWRHPFLSLYGKWFADGVDFIAYPPQVTKYWRLADLKDAAVPVMYRDGGAKYRDGGAAVVTRQAKGRVLLLTTTLDDRESVA